MSVETKDAIRMMLKKSREKLKTAELDYHSERYDDSVSRAYYAIFHAISAVLLSKGFHYSSHNQTIGAFNKEFVFTDIFPKHFSRHIQKLFNDRQIGDYDFEILIDANIADEDIKYAREIIDTCDTYLQKNCL